MNVDTIERFWAKVDKSGDCWLWTAGRAGGNSGEYGSFRINNPRRKVYAHRFSYELSHGPIPDGMLVLHDCDTPLCINPDHLRVGTTADNIQDKVKRGRASKPNAVLVPDDVRSIRKRLQEGEKHKDIASDYPVNREAITKIASGRRWRNVL